MSSDLEPFTPDAIPDRSSAGTPGRRRRSLRLKLAYALFILTIGVWVVDPLLMFAHPAASDELNWIYLYCLLVLFFLFATAFFQFRFRRKEAAIFSCLWVLIIFPWFTPPAGWLFAAAFLVHASPLEHYLSKCNLVRFTEGGSEQSVGLCETFWEDASIKRIVIYDTTGELVLPVSQTPEWIGAVRRSGPSKSPTVFRGKAAHLYGNFYHVEDE
jgi:hypothetical protein